MPVPKTDASSFSSSIVGLPLSLTRSVTLHVKNYSLYDMILFSLSFGLRMFAGRPRLACALRRNFSTRSGKTYSIPFTE